MSNYTSYAERGTWVCELEDKVESLERQNAELRARLQEVEKDAARYRWLRNPSHDVALVIDKQIAPGHWAYRAGGELDDALDQAMKAIAGKEQK